MTLPLIELRLVDCEEIDAFLAERIYEFNARATGYFDAASFAAVQRDATGTILAGISGYTWGGCCYVSHLWVAEEHRGKGVGTSLLRIAEENARRKGCTIALLSSHSFQSPGFYTRAGYEARAAIQDHPIGHSNVVFAKPLAPDAD